MTKKNEKKTIKRKYTPIHPEKYKGDPTQIISRSSWEYFFMRYCDHSSDIIEWSSEEFYIPYVCLTDKKWHRYFPDFRIKFKNGSTYIIEIKPAKETQKPQLNGKRVTKSFLYEVFTFQKNASKWAAAKKYAEGKGWEFVVWTEMHLKKLGMCE